MAAKVAAHFGAHYKKWLVAAAGVVLAGAVQQGYVPQVVADAVKALWVASGG